MSYIESPKPDDPKVKDIANFLKRIGEWQDRQKSPAEEGFLSQLWYRGESTRHPDLRPGVYREHFTARAKRLKYPSDVEDQRLKLEREVLAQFRIAGASFLDRNSRAEIYFSAEHVQIPTRLLDWSTNPLAALFFACNGEPRSDGVVYAMDARQVIPHGAVWVGKERLYPSIMTMRHPWVEYAIGLSFWSEINPDVHPHVLPVRPDVMPGRIAQQSSCFTLHMHLSPRVTNSTLVSIPVESNSKTPILKELHGLNINQFTTYYDLDHLSKEIKRTWGLNT